MLDCIKVSVIPMSVALEKRAEYEAERAVRREEKRKKHLQTVQEYADRLMEKINEKISWGIGTASVDCFRKEAADADLYRCESALRDAVECVKEALTKEGYNVTVGMCGPYYKKILSLRVYLPK